MASTKSLSTIALTLFVIFVIAFSTRYYRLDHPRAVVFDELHYIKFITLYAKNIFFFDPQPPFGKQLMTAFARWIGFDGDLSYGQIGDIYKPDMPIKQLRLLPCLLGSLIAPLAFLISIELGYCQKVAIFMSSLIILENALLTQSRFLLLDPQLIILSMLSLYCYLRYTQSHSLLWFTVSIVCATLAACTKYSGLYGCAHLVGLVAYDWWISVESQLKSRRLARDSLYMISCALIVPTAIYIGVYYVHLSWLTKAGPHDSIMTSAFQASLENGLASITRGQPLEVVHGSQITLRHTHGRSCWLHSHPDLYPIKYSDGRGSSHQQQVTCYSFKDANNWWIVKRPHVEELAVTEPHDKIVDGDLIQLIHGLTGRALNSHDVASAMSPFSQEVSCYVDHNISMPAQNVWKVNLINADATNNHWHTINSRLQLIHLNSSLALRFSGRQLPDWGYHQHEIVADKELKNDDTLWNVEEHRYTVSDDQKERQIQLGQAEFVPLEPTSLTFFQKFYELHYKLISYQQDSIKDHIYACDSPIDWILMNIGTAYWFDGSMKTNAQIYLIGNVTIGVIGIASLFIFSMLIIYYSIRRRRCIYSDLDESTWKKFELQAVVLVSGYLMHLLPYFLYESTLFLHYYLNAMIFKILIIGALVDHLDNLAKFPAWLTNSLMVSAVAKSIHTFLKLAPLAYGLGLTRQELESLRWKETWQLITTSSV